LGRNVSLSLNKISFDNKGDFRECNFGLLGEFIGASLFLLFCSKFLAEGGELVYFNRLRCFNFGSIGGTVFISGNF